MFLLVSILMLVPVFCGQSCPEKCQCARLKWTCGGQKINDTTLLEIARTGDPLTAKELLLKDNLITHFPAKAFSKFTNLEKIDLGQNLLRKPPANVSVYIPSVSNFSIDRNKISKISKEDFIGYQNLTYLDIFNNAISELETGIFQNVPKLQTLVAETNKIKVLKNGTLDNAKELISVSFASNGLERIERDTFTAATKLKILWLDNNSLISLPEGVFRNQQNLSELYLEDNHLTTFRREWFDSPAVEQVEVGLENNPLHCDCALYNAIQYFAIGNGKFEIYGNCETPANLKGDDIHFDIYEKNKLGCTACSLNECENNSTCQVMNATSYNCSCSEKYHGKFCQFENACLIMKPAKTMEPVRKLKTPSNVTAV